MLCQEEGPWGLYPNPDRNTGPLEDDIGSGRDTQAPWVPGVVDQEEDQNLPFLLLRKPHLPA